MKALTANSALFAAAMVRRIRHSNTFITSQRFQSGLNSSRTRGRNDLDWLRSFDGLLVPLHHLLRFSALHQLSHSPRKASIRQHQVLQSALCVDFQHVRMKQPCYIQPCPHRGRVEIRRILRTPHLGCPVSSALATAAPSHPPLRAMRLLMSCSYPSVPDWLSLWQLPQLIHHGYFESRILSLRPRSTTKVDRHAASHAQ